MKPIADLVPWTDDIHGPGAHTRPAAQAGVAMSEAELCALLTDPDGDWA